MRISVAAVAVLGETVARSLFLDEEPVGQFVLVNNLLFQVVGVMSPRGASPTGADQDDIVFVPISTAKLRLMGSASEVNREAVAYILVKAVSDEAMRSAQGQIEALLRQRAWVEDNRRRVDSLSGGRLAYVWVPNTSGPAITAFDRYYFAQQDRQGAVID